MSELDKLQGFLMSLEPTDGRAFALDQLGALKKEVGLLGLRERQIIYLWEALDKIDTASDIFKDNYEGLAERVYMLDKLRHKVATSDGMALEILGEEPEAEDVLAYNISPEQPTEEPQEAEPPIASDEEIVALGEKYDAEEIEANGVTYGSEPVSPVIDATEDFSDEAVRAAGGEPVSRIDALNAKTLQTPHGEINFASPDFGPTES